MRALSKSIHRRRDVLCAREVALLLVTALFPAPPAQTQMLRALRASCGWWSDPLGPTQATDESHTRLRFWQYYAVELADDYYGVYNFSWGYYLKSLDDYCSTGKGTP
jgi:hypothetical protein